MYISSDKQLTITYKDHDQPETDICLHFCNITSRYCFYRDKFTIRDSV